MKEIVLAGAGGFIGSSLRFLVGGVVYRYLPFASLPYGTLFVNVIGCFIIGLLGGLAEGRQLFSPQIRIFVFIGILGGFTTFSSFAYETLLLVRDADYLRAMINVILQVAACLLAVWAGNSIGTYL